MNGTQRSGHKRAHRLSPDEHSPQGPEGSRGCTLGRSPEEPARRPPGPRPGGRFGLIAVVVMLAASLLRGAPALGFFGQDIDLLTERNFDPEAIASEQGQRLTVTGTFVCPEAVRNSQFKVEASVLQQSTQAVFQGVTFGACRNNSGTFSIAGPVQEGRPPFEAGPALACGLAATGRGAPINSVSHWCTFVNIVAE